MLTAIDNAAKKFDDAFDAFITPPFDTESMTLADVPQALSYVATRLLPTCVVLGGLAWIVIAMALVL